MSIVISPVQLCAKLPYFADQCKSLVDTVINYIDQNEDPENICKLITACPEPQPKLKALPIQFPGQVRNGVKSDKKEDVFYSSICYVTF